MRAPCKNYNAYDANCVNCPTEVESDCDRFESLDEVAPRASGPCRTCSSVAHSTAAHPFQEGDKDTALAGTWALVLNHEGHTTRLEDELKKLQERLDNSEAENGNLGEECGRLELELDEERLRNEEAQEEIRRLVGWQGQALEQEKLLAAAQEEMALLRREGVPGVMHAVDEAFYELTVKERNAAWEKLNHVEKDLSAAREQIGNLETEIRHSLGGLSNEEDGCSACSSLRVAREDLVATRAENEAEREGKMYLRARYGAMDTETFPEFVGRLAASREKWVREYHVWLASSNFLPMADPEFARAWLKSEVHWVARFLSETKG